MAENQEDEWKCVDNFEKKFTETICMNSKGNCIFTTFFICIGIKSLLCKSIWKWI